MDLDELRAMIPSETVRQYVLDTGWVFTDMQKAALLYHSCLPLEEQYSYLRKLMVQTTDETLREQISNYLEQQERGLCAFKENRENSHIYVLRVMDEESKEYDSIHSQGYFSRWDMAFAAGQQKGEPFQIEKCMVADAKMPSADDMAACAQLCFDKDGRASSFWSREVSFYEEENASFTHVFYEVPNPFERGDIVKLVGTEDYGIIENGQKDWREVISPEWRQSHYVDYSDVQIRVVFPNEEGTFYHEHIDPVYLERCIIDKDNTKSPLEQLLLCASEIYRGTESFSFDGLYYYMTEYRKAKSMDGGNK